MIDTSKLECKVIEKEYLGDAVYVEYTSGFIKLTTENGYEATNVICLDAFVMKKFDEWRKRFDEEIKQDTA